MRLKMRDIKRISIVLCFFAVFALLSFGAYGVYMFSQENDNITVATGTDNASIQTRLQELGYYNGPIDGVFNEQTRNAVIRFQSDYGLVADGIVGSKTLQMLGLTNSGSAQTSNDLYLIAKCVYAEARGEPYVGKVAVAAVILNRVESPEFPNTIAGVVYQPWAFTAVYDGQINLEPDQECYSAAQDALNGWDPTYGCLYYYNPDTATSQWIFSREVVVTIGKHVFAI